MKRNIFHSFTLAFLLLIFAYPLCAQKKSALELFNQAQELQQQSRWFDAVDLYQEALLLNPQYGDALYNLALCHYALGSYDLSVQYADEASKYARNFSDIQNLKGLSLISLGRVNEAKDVFSQILKKYPNDVNARFGLAELDLLDGRLTVAESRYQDALKRDASNRKALLSLALVSAEMGKPEVSENYIMQALSFYSGEPEVHYMAAYLSAKNGDKLGIIPCNTGVFQRLIPLPSDKKRFMLAEELILHFVSQVFERYTVKEKSLVRVIRNADINADELYDRDLDYRTAMGELIKKRRKLCAVKLELTRTLDEQMVKTIRKHLDLKQDRIFYLKSPLDLSFISDIQDSLRDETELFFKRRVPQKSAFVNERESMIAQIKKRDILLSYPYESMKPFLKLLEEASEDPDVVSIKMTLYRVARYSKVVE